MILQLFYNYILHNESVNTYKELIKICFHVLATDSEEIADTAVKVLHMFFTMQSTQRKIQLSEFREEIIEYC